MRHAGIKIVIVLIILAAALIYSTVDNDPWEKPHTVISK